MLYGPDARTKSPAKASLCVSVCACKQACVGEGTIITRACIRTHACMLVGVCMHYSRSTRRHLIMPMHTHLCITCIASDGKSISGLIGFSSGQATHSTWRHQLRCALSFASSGHPLYVVNSLLIENDMGACDGFCRHLIKPIGTAYSRV